MELKARSTHTFLSESGKLVEVQHCGCLLSKVGDMDDFS